MESFLIIFARAQRDLSRRCSALKFSSCNRKNFRRAAAAPALSRAAQKVRTCPFSASFIFAHCFKNIQAKRSIPRSPYIERAPARTVFLSAALPRANKRGTPSAPNNQPAELPPRAPKRFATAQGADFKLPQALRASGRRQKFCIYRNTFPAAPSGRAREACRWKFRFRRQAQIQSHR